jgi:hypothetical protein
MFDLVHLLTGSSAPPPTLDSMVDLYVAKRKVDLEQAIWYGCHFEPSTAKRLANVYDSLPDSAKFAFLLSPATYEAVDAFPAAPKENCERLLLYAQDQLSIARGMPSNGCSSEIAEIWSPTGGEALVRTGNSWKQKQCIKLDSLIVVDFDSPFARAIRDSPLMAQPAEEFSEEERAAVVKKFQTAMDYVNRVIPTFGRLIRNYTRAARIRKCKAFVDIASEHVTDAIGEIRFMNAHEDIYSVDQVSEDLVHESVHNLLSTYEYLYGKFLLSPENYDYRPVSTWSGNPIPVASFCHAVFVWFALFNMSLRELEQPGLNTSRREQIFQRRNRYAAGFLVEKPLSEYLRDLALFSKDCLPTIDRMQEIVNTLVHKETYWRKEQIGAKA